MKIIKANQLEKDYNVVNGVEKVKVLVEGKVDKRMRKAKFNAVVNKKDEEVIPMKTKRGYIVFDTVNGVYASRFFTVQEYADAKTEAKRLAGEHQTPYELHTMYCTNAERRVKGTAVYFPSAVNAPVYEEVYVVPTPKQNVGVDVIVD